MKRARARVALVTGSSRGLGSVIARRLARDGLAVAVNGLDRTHDTKHPWSPKRLAQFRRAAVEAATRILGR